MAFLSLATQQTSMPNGNGSSCYTTDLDSQWQWFLLLPNRPMICWMDDSRRVLLTELTDQLPGQVPTFTAPWRAHLWLCPLWLDFTVGGSYGAQETPNGMLRKPKRCSEEAWSVTALMNYLTPEAVSGSDGGNKLG